jgi:hypothetical protein
VRQEDSPRWTSLAEIEIQHGVPDAGGFQSDIVGDIPS